MSAGVFGEPVVALVVGLVVWYVKVAGIPVLKEIPTANASVVPVLMIVTNAVAAPPCTTERLDGNTEATREVEGGKSSGRISTAPISQAWPCGRSTPRWSVGTVEKHWLASMAGLPGLSGRV
jgi:hypothetical protein